MNKLIVAVACLILAACGQQQQTSPSGKVHIRFATDWRAQAEHGGFYQALATGEYARRGLDVEIIQGGPSVNVPQLLAAGAVEMGMGSNSFIALNLAREGAPVRAVAATMQKDPQVLMAHPGQGVNSLADMKGRPIMLSDASITGFWLWLKSKYGFVDSQVRANPSPAVFIQDKRAIMQGYVTSEPFIVAQTSGEEPKVFLLADEGYPGYAAMILSTDRLIKEHPEAVRAFIAATAAGWQSYLNGDPSPGDALIRKDNPEKTPAQLAEARKRMKDYGIVESGDTKTLGIGAMTDARWEGFFRMASDAGVYPATLDYHKAYTLEFLGAK